MSWCIEHDLEQGSDEWHALRRGKITGSRANSLFAKTSRGWAKSRKHMISKIAMELLRGNNAPSRAGSTQERGHEYEPQARAAYEFAKMCTVEEAGFMSVVDHPSEGYSPDGLIGDDGLLELKVPTAMEKHVQYLTNNAHVKEYEGQLRHGLYVTGRDWVEIGSYYPECPANLQLALSGKLSRSDLGLADYPDMLSDAWKEINAMRDVLAEIQAAA